MYINQGGEEEGHHNPDGDHIPAGQLRHAGAVHGAVPLLPAGDVVDDGGVHAVHDGQRPGRHPLPGPPRPLPLHKAQVAGRGQMIVLSAITSGLAL